MTPLSRRLLPPLAALVVALGAVLVDLGSPSTRAPAPPAPAAEPAPATLPPRPPVATSALTPATPTPEPPVPTESAPTRSPDTAPRSAWPVVPPARPGEPAFAGFESWLRQWHAADARTRRDEDLEAAGLSFARERREALKNLIRTDPRRALELALSADVRASLPAALAGLLEESVDARGDLEVLCALAEPGREGTGEPIRHYAVFPDRRLRAFVFGNREFAPTRLDVPLRGIAVDGLMAVAESATEEEPDAAPEPAGSRALAASSSSPSLKTLLLIRVDFGDLPGESLSSLRASSLARELDQFYRENSYGRAGFRLIGAGSAVTPVFRLPRTAAYYGGNDAHTTLRNDARTAARNAGYTLGDYQYDVVCLGSVPGFDWSGLGYVGQPGAWIRGTTSTGVTAHELGHNLGLHHANFWDTDGRSVTGAGASIEYGDKFDTMGAAEAGAYHFNARYKRQLGWLYPGEFTVASSNGIYRILAHDEPQIAPGSRGLQIFVNARTNYWIEFRRKFTTNPALLHGAGLRWARRDTGPTLLLDTTPGSAGEKDDSPIALGRTYSDHTSGIHLTPIAQGGSSPAWMDIVVQRGTFPSNRPPLLELDAPLRQGTSATVFEFRATGTDPDDDRLAYFWEFGDDTAGTNSPVARHRWTANGDYVVRCTVSDTRGGLARRSFAVRVGSPGTFRLSGRVIAGGEPLADVRVAAGTGRPTLTDTDGTYLLTGVARGRVTLQATAEDRQFEPVAFRNPLDIAADRAGLDFAALEVATRVALTLVPAGSVWRYWDQGSVIGTAWRNLDYNDLAWNSGPAILGYGGDRETTVISYGPDENRKYITAWFRRGFAVADPTRLSNVRLGLLRDDGAAVYLNGQELLRDNLPSGTLTATTLASASVANANETRYFEFEVSSSRLVAGTNVLAVELHQSSQGSTDTAFDLRLTANLERPAEAGIRLVRPTAGTSLTAPARITFAAALGEFPGHSGARVVRVDFLADGRTVATATDPPYAAVWNDAPPGDFTVAAAALLDDGARIESDPVEIEIRDPGLNPVLIPAGSIWRFLDTGVAPPSSWTRAEFDDDNWGAGPARLGYGEDGEFTVIRPGPDPSRRAITTWFRHRFEIASAEGIDSLRLRLQRDDGAVVHLNGKEVFRTGLRTGVVTPTLTALSDIQNESELAWVERSLDPGDLVDGPNVVAVEMHQFSAASDDLGFDLELRATRSLLPADPVPALAWRLADGRLVLLWPASAAAAGWRLEAAPAVGAAAAWAPATGTPVPAGDRLELPVAVDAGPGPGFYRLARPGGP